jgi:tetratricopeptide (TPR) repeat protein
MTKTDSKPRLVFFRYPLGEKRLAEFIQMHRQEHVRCLSEFFEVVVIQEDCDYQQICDQYEPQLALFEMISGAELATGQKLNISNMRACPDVPRLAFHNADAWCEARSGFISDMEHLGIEASFSLCATAAEHTPEIADELFVWPNFIDADVFCDYGESKIIPVLFTGARYGFYPWRQRIHKIVSESYPSLIAPHRGYTDRSTIWQVMHGERYARTINASWFVPTCGTLAKAVVRKHFEIAAARSCLLTEKSPALEAAGFIDMQNCVFADDDNVLDKLDYLFQNLDELERITNAGYQLVHARHTLKHRDQILQWFNLHENLKPNQRIVQSGPFEPLSVVDKSSNITNSHVTCNGLNLLLIQQGDDKLWAGKYDEAEVLYLKCLNYIYWMPEPKLKLALCSLYQGNAERARKYITELFQYTLEVYKAADPDPVEWAYLIIALLCLGKVDEAVKQAKQFPDLNHPELKRARQAVVRIANVRFETVAFQNEQNESKRRYSIHQLPDISDNAWQERLCTMLKACHQNDLVNTFNQPIPSAKDLTKSQRSNRQSSLGQWRGRFNFLEGTHSKYGFKTIKSKYVTWSRKLKLKSKEEFYTLLRSVELRSKHFLSNDLLPYEESTLRSDEFFNTIHDLTNQETIKTALLIGTPFSEGSTQAFIRGVQKNRNTPIAYYIHPSPSEVSKVKKRLSKHSHLRAQQVSADSRGSFAAKLRDAINTIKHEEGIDHFDIVIIQGSQLCSQVDNNYIYIQDIFNGASHILLDGINDACNQECHSRLVQDPSYSVITQNLELRHGFSVFVKNQD